MDTYDGWISICQTGCHDVFDDLSSDIVHDIGNVNALEIALLLFVKFGREKLQLVSEVARKELLFLLGEGRDSISDFGLGLDE